MKKQSMLALVESKCKKCCINITTHRKVIISVMCDADDHPDAEEIYSRASAINSKISLATVYRTINVFENCKIVSRLEIGDGKARYEINTDEMQHYHLIDKDDGSIIEFFDEEIEKLKTRIGEKLGYTIIESKFELYGRKKQQQPRQDNCDTR